MNLTCLSGVRCVLTSVWETLVVSSCGRLTSSYTRLSIALWPSLPEENKSFNFLHTVVRRIRDPIVLRDELISELIGGRDTTAVCLCWLFYPLAQNPSITATLRHETLSTVGKERVRRQRKRPGRSRGKQVVHCTTIRSNLNYNEVIQIGPPACLPFSHTHTRQLIAASSKKIPRLVSASNDRREQFPQS